MRARARVCMCVSLGVYVCPCVYVCSLVRLPAAIDRMRLHLEARGAWDSDKEAAMRQAMKKQVVACLNEAERAPKPPIGDLFTDVYQEMPPRLKEQKAALEEHLAKYPEAYNLGKYAQE
mmetsp:Transcript_19050/g.38512  ORF Transcript_19050/g.38512 Transcript_19050/m.38512 type:complete len:119 (+) Transcript_19050:152-508(+)